MLKRKVKWLLSKGSQENRISINRRLSSCNALTRPHAAPMVRGPTYITCIGWTASDQADVCCTCIAINCYSFPDFVFCFVLLGLLKRKICKNGCKPWNRYYCWSQQIMSSWYCSIYLVVVRIWLSSDWETVMIKSKYFPNFSFKKTLGEMTHIQNK